GLNASQNFTLTVQAVAATVSVSSSVNPSVFGQPVTFTATVIPSTGTSSAGAPTGVVQFDLDGGVGGAVALTNGVATFSTAALATGTHVVSVTYNGDENYLPAFAMLTPNQQVVPANTTTQLTARMGGGLYQTDVLLEATVTPVAPGAGTPFGTVTFTGDLLAPTTVALDANGHASIVVLNAARGNLSFTATYNGNSNFNTSANTQAVFAPHVVIMPLVFK
ncbi:Ig-like domain repeat protein, partial [bacterium]|nr:Ig-like domain repeat protein [bacterium]